MGTEIVAEDQQKIKDLANEIIDLFNTSEKMEQYISNRMMKIAPNFSKIVGPVIGARLLAKTGSLVKLAKSPASTI